MKLGSVPYLNALPLTCGASYPIQRETPRKLRELLTTGALDVALLSTVVLFETPGLFLLPGMGIGSRGPVWSVKLYFKKEHLSIENIKTIKLSPESNSANMLLKVLLARAAGRDLAALTWTEHDSADVDAELVIGDAALLRESPFGAVDLGAWWQDYTQLPFVFAAWISRHATIPAALHAELLRCKTQNVSALEAVVSAPHHLDYLQHAIRYDLGEQELAGLERFRQECATIGTIAQPEPIRFSGFPPSRE